MQNIPLVFSIAFFLACSIAWILGIYIIYLNPKELINRIFCILTISLGIWGFGFSLAISSSNIETCFFWRRISALGWGSFFSLLLHFFLLLTETKNMLRKWWIYVILYLPSAITIYVFVISTELAKGLFNLIFTSLGWRNIQVSNAWDWFYYIYYASFVVCGLGIVWRWGRRASMQKIKNQSKIILFSFITAFLLGTVSDIIFNTYLSINSPQIAPIIILIPIINVYYCIRKYELMNPKEVSKDELILNEATRISIYNYLSISFIIGGFLNFISQYLLYENANLLKVMNYSFTIAFIAVIIQMVLRLKISENYKDIIIICTVSLIIPIITLRFIQYASITIWAFPFILIIISMVFNKRTVLAAISVSIIITQVSVWVLAPKANVRIDGMDHIARIGLFSIAIWIAFYVNKIYVLRLKENAEQIGFQKLISDISSDFINVNLMNLDEKIDNMLRKSGQFFQVDRIYVFLHNDEYNTMNCTHEWCREGIKPAVAMLRKVSIDKSTWLKKITSSEAVNISDVEKLPVQEKEEIKQFVGDDTKSFILIPIAGKSEVLGFIGFDSVKLQKKWRDGYVNLLKIISNPLADALTKVEAEKEINFRAYYDQLTKLPNRILFNDRLNQAIHLARRTNKVLGVIFLDLDSFKAVNDTLGHDGGDELITLVGKQLSHCVRKSDTVSRFGGDEFLVMINNISERTHVANITEKIMGVFKKPFMIKGQEFFVTASAGISLFPEDGEESETLIKNADIAMYNAKDKGKNQFVLCSPEMKDEVLTRMKLTNRLYRAMERNELVLNYQPQVSRESKKVSGLEALIRWNHPELGMISPAIFIPLAEQTGLINSIGEWVLKTACQQNKMWQEMGLPPVRMAVNLSVNQFRNPNLVSQIDRILKDTGLSPEYLELEITESVAIKEADYIISVLNDLKGLGVSISIDDFGTEYSSLSRFKMLPADRIKIDMQFVRGIDGNDKDKAIINVIIQLAKSLGIRIIAEGVETKSQLEYLYQRMCDEVQGYYYYKPMAAPDIENILKNLIAKQ